MDCEAYEALAVDLLYGELTPERRSDAAAHAASCSECGKLASELDEARRTASSLPSRIAPPPELDERILLAARMAVDVRQQPIRGSGLHVAAAAVMAALLVGVSFVVGMNVGRPKILGQDPDDRPLRPIKNPGVIETDVNATPGAIRPNTDREQWRKYLEGLLEMANADLAKGDQKRALMGFGAAYSGGGRTEMALEGRIGMAKCFRALGQIDDARAAARDAREKNMDWGTNFDKVEAEASRLIVELNQEQQKKLQQR